MKRVFALVLALVLLLAGCETVPPEDTAPAAKPTEATAAPTEATAAPTEEPSTEAPTEEATEPPATAESTQPETVTVYLLVKSVIADSGHMEYIYDSNYNIVESHCVTIENEPMYTGYWEEPDANGMPCRRRVLWAYGDEFSQVLTFFADGKPESVLDGSDPTTGFRYYYDNKGDLIRREELYEGEAYNTVFYEYEGETLTAVYARDAQGNLVFDSVLENGRILEKNYYDSGEPYAYRFEYDAFGNLVGELFVMDGETLPGVQYHYEPVEVSQDRAWYLIEQQKLLLDFS